MPNAASSPREPYVVFAQLMRDEAFSKSDPQFAQQALQGSASSASSW
jgi:hypothetical protein